mmetsp:Transcript_47632/g.101974  ORF Transcript_47632/g.101974 Transcript_47632/m.101974 type:complete len:349 (-) Transcript_47632:341-1387(-)
MFSIRTFLLLGIYILTSACLIRFNKYMMQKDMFPYSMALTLIHMIVSSLLCLLLYWIKPSLFPGMEATEGKRMALLPWFVPIGLCFAVSLFTSNQAYMYCDVAFLQFMKENNVMITFLLSCAVGVQLMDRLKFLIVAWVVGTSAFAVGEELHFIWVGFLLQATSQIAECTRAVLGECVLNGRNLKLDPLTYTLFASPTCLVVLLVGVIASWDYAIYTAAMKYWYLIVPNALLAFSLNLMVATIIKEASAVGFTMAGVVKDIFIVVISAIAFHEVVTARQTLGFAGSILGICAWSVVKMHPDSDVVQKAYSLVGLSTDSKLQAEALNAKAYKDYGGAAEEGLSATSKKL